MVEYEKQVGQGNEILKRLEELELSVAALESGSINNEKILTRKKLAQLLSCSERYLQSHPEFKWIENRMGNRVYYNWADVKRIIFNKKKGKENE